MILTFYSVINKNHQFFRSFYVFAPSAYWRSLIHILSWNMGLIGVV